MIVFTVPGAEIDRRGRAFAILTSQARKKFPKTHIAALLHQQAHRQDCRTPAAVQLQPALRPVGQTVREKEGRRMHGGKLRREQIANKRLVAGGACGAATADPNGRLGAQTAEFARGSPSLES